MTEREPKSCLFCGARNFQKTINISVEHGPVEGYRVACLYCAAMGPVRESKWDAIKAWNEPHIRKIRRIKESPNPDFFEPGFPEVEK